MPETERYRMKVWECPECHTQTFTDPEIEAAKCMDCECFLRFVKLTRAVE